VYLSRLTQAVVRARACLTAGASVPRATIIAAATAFCERAKTSMKYGFLQPSRQMRRIVCVLHLRSIGERNERR
jgi:hypothetical protein